MRLIDADKLLDYLQQEKNSLEEYKVNKENSWSSYIQGVLVGLREGLKNAIAKAEAIATVEEMAPFPQWIDDRPKWIPCSEKLPPYDKGVWVTTRNHDSTIGSRQVIADKTEFKDVWSISGVSTLLPVGYVVAWMPLPETYPEPYDEE